MAIHEDFAEFMKLKPVKRERAFQEQVIIPLLQRLGFTVVWNNHGFDEYGRDAIFGTVDQFGELLWFGMQVKFKLTLGKGQATGLIDQVRDAFNTPFHSEKPGQQGKIARFYVVNAGPITDQFATVVRAGVERQGLVGPGLRFLGGETIAHLSKWAAYSTRQFVREQLTGMLLEIAANQQLIPHILDTFEQKKNVRERFRNAAASAYLTHPFAVDQIGPEHVWLYWQMTQAANSLLDRVVEPFAIDEYRHNTDIALRATLDDLKKSYAFFVERIKGLLSELALPS